MTSTCTYNTVRMFSSILLQRYFLVQAGQEADRAADQPDPLHVRHVAALRVHQHRHRRTHLHLLG